MPRLAVQSRVFKKISLHMKYAYNYLKMVTLYKEMEASTELVYTVGALP